jgi:hypothetical protein
MLTIYSGRFRLTPQYQWLLNKYKADSLSAIHLGLACEDRQWAMIRMLRLVQYPVGTHILGIDSNLSICSVYVRLMLNRNPARVSP